MNTTFVKSNRVINSDVKNLHLWTSLIKQCVRKIAPVPGTVYLLCFPYHYALRN